jgi:hypothetical protein
MSGGSTHMKRGEVGALLRVAGHPFGLLPPPL